MVNHKIDRFQSVDHMRFELGLVEYRKEDSIPSDKATPAVRRVAVPVIQMVNGRPAAKHGGYQLPGPCAASRTEIGLNEEALAEKLGEGVYLKFFAFVQANRKPRNERTLLRLGQIIDRMLGLIQEGRVAEVRTLFAIEAPRTLTADRVEAELARLDHQQPYWKEVHESKRDAALQSLQEELGEDGGSLMCSVKAHLGKANSVEEADQQITLLNEIKNFAGDKGKLKALQTKLSGANYDLGNLERVVNECRLGGAEESAEVELPVEEVGRWDRRRVRQAVAGVVLLLLAFGGIALAYSLVPHAHQVGGGAHPPPATTSYNSWGGWGQGQT